MRERKTLLVSLFLVKAGLFYTLLFFIGAWSDSMGESMKGMAQIVAAASHGCATALCHVVSVILF